MRAVFSSHELAAVMLCLWCFLDLQLAVESLPLAFAPAVHCNKSSALAAFAERAGTLKTR